MANISALNLRRGSLTQAPAPDTENEALDALIGTLFPREAARPVSYRQRTFLYHQGDTVSVVFFLLSGMAAIERVEEDGRMAILGIMKAGTILAWADVIECRNHGSSAQILSPSEVVLIPRAAFIETLGSDARLISALMHQASLQVGAYEEHIIRLSTLEVTQRLYSTLCAFARNQPNVSDVVEFEVPLLKRDIAALIGTSPEGISRGLKRLEEMEIIEFCSRDIVRLRLGQNEALDGGISRRADSRD